MVSDPVRKLKKLPNKAAPDPKVSRPLAPCCRLAYSQRCLAVGVDCLDDITRLSLREEHDFRHQLLDGPHTGSKLTYRHQLAFSRAHRNKSLPVT